MKQLKSIKNFQKENKTIKDEALLSVTGGKVLPYEGSSDNFDHFYTTCGSEGGSDCIETMDGNPWGGYGC